MTCIHGSPSLAMSSRGGKRSQRRVSAERCRNPIQAVAREHRARRCDVACRTADKISAPFREALHISNTLCPCPSLRAIQLAGLAPVPATQAAARVDFQPKTSIPLLALPYFFPMSSHNFMPGGSTFVISFLKMSLDRDPTDCPQATADTPIFPTRLRSAREHGVMADIPV